MEATFYLGCCLFAYMVAFSYVLYTVLEKSHIHYSKKLDIILKKIKAQL